MYPVFASSVSLSVWPSAALAPRIPGKVHSGGQTIYYIQIILIAQSVSLQKKALLFIHTRVGACVDYNRDHAVQKYFDD